MKWLVLVLLPACYWLPDDHHGDPRLPPLEAGVAPDHAVHCGTTQVTDGQFCDPSVDFLCEYSEGVDGGTGGPYENCRCRSVGVWYCYSQPLPTCAPGDYQGQTCTTGAQPCEYEIEADAGPANSYHCTCFEGHWQCVLP